MSDSILLANLLFSEASKNPKDIDSDSQAIAWVVKNRASRPQRFGGSISDVVFAPSQFSGVGTKEWNKAVNRKFTPEEEKIYKRQLQIASMVLNDKLPDPTGGADHYFNPKLVKPSWSRKMKKTYTSGSHDYYKE